MYAASSRQPTDRCAKDIDDFYKDTAVHKMQTCSLQYTVERGRSGSHTLCAHWRLLGNYSTYTAVHKLQLCNVPSSAAGQAATLSAPPAAEAGPPY